MRNAPNAQTRFAHNPLQLGPIIPMRCTDSLKLALTQCDMPMSKDAGTTTSGEQDESANTDVQQATDGEQGSTGLCGAGGARSKGLALQVLEDKFIDFSKLCMGWAALFMDTKDEKDMQDNELTPIQTKLIKFRMACMETPYMPCGI